MSPCSTLSNDRFIYEITGKVPGFYLELGCNRGTSDSGSNCIYLEFNGWNGIGMDCCFIGDFNNNRKGTGIEIDLMNKPFEDALDELGNVPSIIDFLSYDVDQAIRPSLHLFTGRYKFKHIHIEHNAYIKPEDDTTYIGLKEEIYDKLSSLGYIRLISNVLDDNRNPVEDWYVHPSFVNVSSYPTLSDIHHKEIYDKFFSS